MHKLLILLSAIWLGVGCVPNYVIVPAAGGDVGTASADGLILQADADAWGGRPQDLTEYMLPIWVQITG